MFFNIQIVVGLLFIIMCFSKGLKEVSKNLLVLLVHNGRFSVLNGFWIKNKT